MTARLPITLDRTSGVPLYRQIEAQVRQAIDDARVRPGRRLPSVRALAADLGVGRLTVATAYEQLAADGYTLGRVGSGTIVAPSPPRDERIGDGHDRGRGAVAPSTLRLVRGGIATERQSDPVRLELRPGRRPGPGIGAGPILERLMRDAWRDVADGVRRPGAEEAGGDARLRVAIAAHLAATRGARVVPERVVVVSGAVLGLTAVARTRHAVLGADLRLTAAVEDPGDPVHRGALALAGAALVPVPVDRHGIVVAAVPHDAQLVLVGPTVQSATGASLPLARRLQLLARARASGALVVEDARWDELRFRGESLGSLLALEDADEVVHLGSFESILHDGVRIGYLVLPEALVAPVTAVLASVDPGPTSVQQVALAAFIEDGHFERHLARVRRALAEREEVLREAIRESLGWLATVERVDGGTRLVVGIEDPAWTASVVVRAAARVGVGVESLAGWRAAPGADRELVLDFGRLTPPDLRTAVRLLAHALGADARTGAVGPPVRALAGRGIQGWPPSATALAAGRNEP